VVARVSKKLQQFRRGLVDYALPQRFQTCNEEVWPESGRRVGGLLLCTASTAGTITRLGRRGGAGESVPGGQDVTVEAPERLAPTPSAADDAEVAARRDRRVWGWRGAAPSARTRILIAYVVLLALAAVLAMLGFRQFLHVRVENEANDDLRQEVQELDRLLTVGRDPETGRPFASLGALFDVYFTRNIPGEEEAFLGFVQGKLYRSSTLTGFPLDQLPIEKLIEWQRLGSRSPGEGETATGSVHTKLGDAYFRAARIRFHDDVGAFVVTILPADERKAIADFLTYGGTAALGVLLIASACAWLIAGRVLEPVRLLTDTAQSISRSNLTERIEVRGTGEAADMARTFNAMLDRLEAVFESQREFVQDTNHELRDPITIVRAHLQLMDDDPEERQRTVKLALDELDRMGRIVGDLKLLAEADQPGFLQRERVDPADFTLELAAKARALAPRHWPIDHEGGAPFFADRHRLTQAVMNLAHNAVQHTDDSDTIAIGTSVGEDEVRLWVRDTGTGISMSDQVRIFDRFTRGTGSHSRYAGSGLGLAIVKAIAEAHGGQVEVESRLDEGSTFTIIVPREPSEGGAGGQDLDR
jgi:two-component system, OmpR family, sensor kinase